MRLAVRRGPCSSCSTQVPLECHGRDGKAGPGRQTAAFLQSFSHGHMRGRSRTRASWRPGGPAAFRESQTCAHVLGTCHGRMSPRAGSGSGSGSRAARAGQAACAPACPPVHHQPAPHCKAANAPVALASTTQRRGKLHARFPRPASGSRHGRQAPHPTSCQPSLGAPPLSRMPPGWARGQVKPPAAPTGVDVRAGSLRWIQGAASHGGGVSQIYPHLRRGRAVLTASRAGPLVHHLLSVPCPPARPRLAAMESSPV